MAETGAGTYRTSDTEAPARRRARKARCRAPPSCPSAAVCIAAAVAIYSLGRMAAGQLRRLDARHPEPAAGHGHVRRRHVAAADHRRRARLWIVLPILAATFFAALAAPLAIGGWNFSGKALMPQFSRLNPGERHSAACSRRAAWWSWARASPRSPSSASSPACCCDGLTPQLMGLSSEPVDAAIGHSASAGRLLAAGAGAAAWPSSRRSTCRTSSGSTPRTCA